MLVQVTCSAAAGVGKDHKWRLHDTTNDVWSVYFGTTTKYRPPSISGFDTVALGSPGCVGFMYMNSALTDAFLSLAQA